WHWFDSERALSEAKRVLRPGGGIGFFWNDYDENSDLLREVAELRKRYSNGEPTQTENTWREPIDTSEVWGPLNEETFAHTMRVDISSMTERALSSSVIARRPAAERQRIQHEIEEIILRHAGGHDQIDVAYITLVYWTRLR